MTSGIGDRFRRARKFLGTLRAAWLLLGATLVALVGAELLLRLAFAAKDAIRPLPPIDPRVVAEGYGGEPGVRVMYRELAAIEMEREPYVEFRAKPISGHGLNIGQDGLRTTWRPPESAGGGRPFEVVVLGGSLAWGWGARDDFTLPSQLAKALHVRGIEARVENHAQIGYVSTQEAIALSLSLRAGHVPDAVVIYGGVNDVLSSLQNGRAGWPQNEANRRREFGLAGSTPRLFGALASDLLADSAFLRLATSAARRVGLERPPRPASAPADLIAPTLAAYEDNLRSLALLARQHGFAVRAYWQPVVFTKKHMTTFEREKAVQYDWLRAPMLAARAKLDTIDPPEPARFRDLGGLFDDTHDLIFTDFCHTTESANVPIAAAIADDLAELLDAGASRP